MARTTNQPELTANERQKPHKARAFHGAGEQPLMRSTHARVARIYDLRLTGNKTLQEIHLLVINVF